MPEYPGPPNNTEELTELTEPTGQLEELLELLTEDEDVDAKTLITEDELNKIKKLYESTKTAWQTDFNDVVKDLDFAAGNQWSDAAKAQREAQGLACLTINKAPSIYKYIVNNVLANPNTIKCSPASMDANDKICDVLNGHTEVIWERSQANQCTGHGFRQAVIGGFGAWEVEIVEGDDGKHVPQVTQIFDGTTVYPDPTAKRVDFADMLYCFQDKSIPEQTARVMFGDVVVDELLDAEATTAEDDSDESRTIDAVVYWRIVGQGREKHAERIVYSGDKVLEYDNKYGSRYIPIMICVGEIYIDNRKRRVKGIIRDTRDMQVLHNMAVSRQADALSRESTAQYIGTAKMFAGHEHMWSSTNVSGLPVLIANVDQGLLPKRADPAQTNPLYSEVAAESDASIRATTGIRDPLRDIPASQSGKAITQQIAQADIGTYGYVNNYKASVRYTGVCLVDIMQWLYDDARSIPVKSEDGAMKMVQINQANVDNDGNEEWLDIRQGSYDISISTSPDYQTQKKEANEQLTLIAQAMPQFAPALADLIVRSSGFQGSDLAAERLRAMMPPELQMIGKDADKNFAMAMQQLNQLKQQMQQLTQQNQMLNQQNQQMQMQVTSKTAQIQAQAQADQTLNQQKHGFDIQKAVIESTLDTRREQKKIVTETQGRDWLKDQETFPQLPTPEQTAMFG